MSVTSRGLAHLRDRDAAWSLGFVIAVIREPWIRLRIMSVVTRGLAPLWAGCSMVAWIWYGSDQGALDSAWVNACRFPRSMPPW